MRRLVILLGVAGVMLALAAGVVQAQATNETTVTAHAPFTEFLTNPCNGELLVLDGHVTFVFHFTDNTHRSVFVDHLNTQASGIGGFGNEYVINQTVTVAQIFSTGEVFTVAGHLNVIGKGDTPDFMSHQVFHATITPDGKATALAEQTKAECKG